jgi:hypothetical protein
LSPSYFMSTGPTWRETMDRLVVNRWPSLREIRRRVLKLRAWVGVPIIKLGIWMAGARAEVLHQRVELAG